MADGRGNRISSCILFAVHTKDGIANICFGQGQVIDRTCDPGIEYLLDKTITLKLKCVGGRWFSRERGLVTDVWNVFTFV